MDAWAVPLLKFLGTIPSLPKSPPVALSTSRIPRNAKSEAETLAAATVSMA